MLKNVLQSILYGVGAILIGMSANVIFPVCILVVGAVVAAFESSRFLSATEVGLTSIAIVLAMSGQWVASIVFLAVLVAENLAFVFAPLRLRLMQLDDRDRRMGQTGEG